MSKTPQMFRKRDILVVAAVLAAVLVGVLVISALVDRSPKKNANDRDDTPKYTTAPVVTDEPALTEDTEATEPETLPEETTPDQAPETAPASTEPLPEGSETPAPEATEPSEPEPVPETEPDPVFVDPEAVTMKEDTGAPPETLSYDIEEVKEILEEVKGNYSATGYNNNIKNIVLLGIDKTSLGTHTDYRTGGQCDVMMVLSMDLAKKEYWFITVNRDLCSMVENFSKSGESYGFVEEQICLSYAYGDGSRVSGRLAMQSLDFIFAETLPFLGYIAAPTTIITKLADAVGGVPVLIEDDFTGVDSTLVKGTTVTLKGKHAETFVRARMAMHDGNTNEYRMSRQMAFCNAFIEKCKTLSARELVDVYDNTMSTLRTDMGRADVTKWITALYDYDFKGFYRLDGEWGPDKNGTKARYIGTNEVMDLVVDLYYKKAQ